MGTKCAQIVVDLFLFCYERDYMMLLSEEKQSDVIEAFSSTSSYLDDLLNIDNKYFDSLISQSYLSELQFNKANPEETEALFLDLHLSILGGCIACKICDKRDDFDLEIVKFPYLYRDVPRRASYGVIYRN